MSDIGISIEQSETEPSGWSASAINWATGNRFSSGRFITPRRALYGLVRYLVEELETAQEELRAEERMRTAPDGFELGGMRYRCLSCDPLEVDAPDVVDPDVHVQWHAKLAGLGE